VRSIWAGLRPLVKPSGENADATKGLSREHTILLGRSNMVTVTGGKWTTYRAMAEDVLEQCARAGLLPASRPPRTGSLRLVGAPESNRRPLSDAPGLHLYGLDAQRVQSLPGHDRELAPGLSEAMVRFAARHELARSVEDVLARRSRLLFLDAACAIRVAGRVSQILAEELGNRFDADRSASSFRDLAANYLISP
jgi:glycerol-3-phosphate dehydrogenase